MRTIDGRTTIDELREHRLAALSKDESATVNGTYEATRLALDVGEKLRDARESAGLSQRELAERMGISRCRSLSSQSRATRVGSVRAAR